MTDIFAITSLALLGACVGSFSVAQVYRIRLSQLSSTKKLTSVERAELNKLKKIKLTPKKPSVDRSKCLSCGYQLAPLDLIPVFSWLFLRGRCRKCKKTIGFTEFLTEITLTIVFPLSFIFWHAPLETPLAIAQFTIWIIFLTTLTILFVYDLRWKLLPTFLLTTLIIAAILFVLCSYDTIFTVDRLTSVFLAVTILSGTYFILHHASKGRWVGSGDWLLALPMALILQDWFLAILTLFLANFIGCLAVIPSLARKKLTTNSAIPLGPLLIIAFIIIFFTGSFLTTALLP